MLSGYVEREAAPAVCEPVTMREIAHDVCRRHGLTLGELTSTRRTRRISWPRQEFMALAMALKHTSSPMVGRFLGGMDHSTVLYGVRAHWKRVGAL